MGHERFQKFDNKKVDPKELSGVVEIQGKIEGEVVLEELETQEQEPPETAIEKARAGRADLLKNLFFKSINFVPVYADVPIAVGALLGREGLRKLSSTERLSYIAALGVVLLSYVHAYEGNFGAAGVDTLVINTIMGFDMARMVTKKLAGSLQESPKITRMKDAVSDYLSKKRADLSNLIELLKNSSTGLTPESGMP